ncbi:tripartite tricarboxylate transporter substrate-binding protein [Saccharopolyspora sp. ID03-671]|uniref:Bug family tripartite tricarboxylate transporter substrate binding protein n=1 Tax=Saccharopolyspora sp. ID03-671 TaxID=3073066 RepID=UPI00325089F0
MTARRTLTRIGLAAASLLLVGAGVGEAYEAARPSAGMHDKLRIIAPAAPGGGWDTTARELQNAAQANDLTGTGEVLNVEGAGGTIGLARLVNQPGDTNTLMLTGTTMLGAVEINGSPATVQDTTPIAKITEDFDAIVVPANSPLRTTADLVQRWRTDPGAVAVGGGSIGSLDHLLAGSLAGAAGVGPSDLNYIAHSGGGEMVASLLGGHLDVGVANTNEISDQVETGELRALGVGAPERSGDLPGTPTLREQGIDIAMSNWRGLTAAPGLDEADEKRIQDYVRKLTATPQWRDALERNNWIDAFQTGPEFQRFLRQDTENIRAITSRLGLS